MCIDCLLSIWVKSSINIYLFQIQHQIPSIWCLKRGSFRQFLVECRIQEFIWRRSSIRFAPKNRVFIGFLIEFWHFHFKAALRFILYDDNIPSFLFIQSIYLRSGVFVNGKRAIEQSQMYGNRQCLQCDWSQPLDCMITLLSGRAKDI